MNKHCSRSLIKTSALFSEYLRCSRSIPPFGPPSTPDSRRTRPRVAFPAAAMTSTTDFDNAEISQQYSRINTRFDLADEDLDNDNCSARLFERSRIKALAGESTRGEQAAPSPKAFVGPHC